jgi:hypothetical protein
MALPNTKVEIAFDSGYTTPAASRTWTDVSAYVEGALPVGIRRGRQDEVSQVQPSGLTLTLNNRDGRFTPRLASGAYYPNVKKGRPIRITCTYNAVSYTRYLGYVSEWPVSWPDGTSADAVVVLTSASRMARMGRGTELRSVVEEEILADPPAAYYTLGEAAGSTSAADSSGNQAPALTMAGTGTAVVFGTATGPTGGGALTAATFADGKFLSTTASVPSSGALEVWFATTNTTAIRRPIIGAPLYYFAVTSGVVDGTAAFVADGAWHQLLVNTNGATADLYLDGALSVAGVGAINIPAISVGGLLNYSGGAQGQFIGSIAHVVPYSAPLSAAQVAANYQAGSTGFAGESGTARLTRLAGYAGIPSAEVSAGASSSTIGHFDITGMTPIAAMQKVVETENGVLYDAKDGTLTFKGRDARYTVASSFTLDCTAQEVEADLEPKDDDQFVVNDVTATANGTPAGRAIDQTSIDDQGAYKQNLDTVTDNADDALAGAQWKVYQGADPAPRYTTVTVDVTNSSTSQAAAILAAEIGTRFTLTNLPSQAPGLSVDLFVEGYSEEITATSHRITFNTSPAAGYDVWTIEDAVFGQYDAYPIAY